MSKQKQASACQEKYREVVGSGIARFIQCYPAGMRKIAREISQAGFPEFNFSCLTLVKRGALWTNNERLLVPLVSKVAPNEKAAKEEILKLFAASLFNPDWESAIETGAINIEMSPVVTKRDGSGGAKMTIEISIDNPSLSTLLKAIKANHFLEEEEAEKKAA